MGVSVVQLNSRGRVRSPDQWESGKKFLFPLRTQQGGYNPVHHMSNIVVGQRIKHFSSALEKIGFMAQLITLPQFHTEAERGYSVARAYQQQGIEGYVQHVQRVEEHLPSGYTFLGHQKAVGTGVEAQLYENLFAKASAILHDSTEKHFH